jgi:hypothetical protein
MSTETGDDINIEIGQIWKLKDDEIEILDLFNDILKICLNGSCILWIRKEEFLKKGFILYGKKGNLIYVSGNEKAMIERLSSMRIIPPIRGKPFDMKNDVSLEKIP